MPGLVPGIYVLRLAEKEDVDGRAKPGHDEIRNEFVLVNQRQCYRNLKWPSS
jgi:hypothetical protein